MPDFNAVDATVEPPQRLDGGLSLVWLLPLLAIGFALWVFWQNYTTRGPLISIRFDDAGGVKAGETVVRHNDVDVGQVEAVELGDDIGSVIIKVRMNPKVEPWVNENARFWIVNARFTTTEISGLSTLLSGPYLEVDWDEEQGEPQTEFVGLEEPPLVRRHEPGIRLTLQAEEAGYIYPGSPVYMRQIEVGRVERRRIADNGRRVLFDIFIAAPYHRHVYPQTRYFSVSGVEARVDSEGAVVRVESLSAFFTGGVGIDNPPETIGTEPLDATMLADSGQVFRLYESRHAAADSLADEIDNPAFRYSLRIQGSVKGLQRGAPVEYNGLRVGRVLNVASRLPETVEDPPEATVVLQLYPRQFGLADNDEKAFVELLDALVAAGMHAQLASGNLLTGAMLIKLVVRSDGAAGSVDMAAMPYPSIPALPSNVEAVTADVETLIANLAALPLDTLASSLVELVGEARSLLGSPALEQLPEQLSRSMTSLESIAARVDTATAALPEMLAALTRASNNADDVLAGLSPDSSVYVELSAAVRELRRAARSIADFAEYLEDNPNAIITGR